MFQVILRERYRKRIKTAGEREIQKKKKRSSKWEFRYITLHKGRPKVCGGGICERQSVAAAGPARFQNTTTWKKASASLYIFSTHTQSEKVILRYLYGHMGKK
jgi:hypothetical protein